MSECSRFLNVFEHTKLHSPLTPLYTLSQKNNNISTTMKFAISLVLAAAYSDIVIGDAHIYERVTGADEKYEEAYNGKIYGTLGKRPKTGSGTSCQDSYITLPVGYVLAPDTSAIRTNVVAKFNWDTHIMILASGKGYVTSGYSSPGSEFGDSQTKYSKSGNSYKARWCSYQILYERSIPDPDYTAPAGDFAPGGILEAPTGAKVNADHVCTKATCGAESVACLVDPTCSATILAQKPPPHGTSLATCKDGDEFKACMFVELQAYGMDVNMDKLGDGRTCTSFSSCSSGVCRGGNCCNRKGKSTGCTDCNSDGDCRTCSAGYKKSSYECFPKTAGDGGEGGEVGERGDGQRLVDSTTGQRAHTFSGLGRATKVLLTVEQSGALADSDAYLIVTAGRQATLSSWTAPCITLSAGWAKATACTAVDVTSHVSASGNLQVLVDASPEVNLQAEVAVRFLLEAENGIEGLSDGSGAVQGDAEVEVLRSNITINYYVENSVNGTSRTIHRAYANLNQARERAKVTEPIIRLFKFAEKPSNHGRLEAKLTSEDTWSTVCDDDFDANDGIVACRQLGFVGYERHRKVTTPLGFIGSMASVNRIQFDDLKCNGSETRLTDCAGSTFGSSNCLHMEDVVLYCAGEQSGGIKVAHDAAEIALRFAEQAYVNALTFAGCDAENEYYNHATQSCADNIKAGNACSPELNDMDCKMYANKDGSRIQMYCVDNWEQGFGYTTEWRDPNNDFVCSCTPRPDFSDYTTTAGPSYSYGYSWYCNPDYNFDWNCMEYGFDGSETFFYHVLVVAGLAGLACCCCISSPCVSKFCGNTKGCLRCFKCGCCPDCCSRQCGEAMCTDTPTCEVTACCGICGLESKSVNPGAWFASVALCMCCVPMIGLSAAQTGLVNDGAAQSFSEQFGCLEKYAGPDHEYGYLTFAGWAIAFFCLTACSCCTAFAVCIKGFKTWRDATIDTPDAQGRAERRAAKRRGRNPDDTIGDATRKYAVRLTTFSFLCSVAAFSMPLSKAKSWRWIGWATWAQIGLTLTIFPLMFAVLDGRGCAHFLHSLGWVFLVVFFIGGTISAIKLINETEVFEGGGSGLDLKTSAMFGIIAGILLLSQLGARLLRSREFPLPLLVEFIIYCSALDLVSDIIYFMTATFHSTGLEFLSIGFCILPFIALVCAFIFRCYRLVTRKNLMWRLQTAAWSFTVAEPVWHLTLVYPALAACYAVVVGVFLFFVSLPVEVVLQILLVGIKAGYAASKQSARELAEFVTDETGAIWKYAVDMYEGAKDKGMAWMEISLLMLPPTLLMFVGLFVCVLIATVIMLVIFVLGYVVVLPIIMVTQTLFWIVASLFFPIFWAVMVMMRTFAIFPGAWLWLENQCEWYTSHMNQMADEGIFVYRPRDVASKSGQDRGVFNVFHPKLKEDEDIPETDNKALYLLISGTLIFEFVFETAPQIILQTINNFKIQQQYEEDRGLYDEKFGNSTNASLQGRFAHIPADMEMFPNRPGGQPVLGWTPFAIVCIAVSLGIAVDALYRQWFQVCCLKKEFGSAEVWSRRVKKDGDGQVLNEIQKLERGEPVDKPPPREETEMIKGIREKNLERLRDHVAQEAAQADAKRAAELKIAKEEAAKAKAARAREEEVAKYRAAGVAQKQARDTKRAAELKIAKEEAAKARAASVAAHESSQARSTVTTVVNPAFTEQPGLSEATKENKAVAIVVVPQATGIILLNTEGDDLLELDM